MLVQLVWFIDFFIDFIMEFDSHVHVRVENTLKFKVVLWASLRIKACIYCIVTTLVFFYLPSPDPMLLDPGW